jgi:hypothetical protein
MLREMRYYVCAPSVRVRYLLKRKRTLMANKELTAQQELFLDYLFNDPECDRNTKRACEAAGYATTYHRHLVSLMRDEIMDRTGLELAMAAPKAVKKLVGTMDEDGSTPKAEVRFKAVESIMDRVGLAKKQQLEVTSESAIPLFILPEKKEVIIEEEKDAPTHEE